MSQQDIRKPRQSRKKEREWDTQDKCVECGEKTERKEKLIVKNWQELRDDLKKQEEQAEDDEA